MNLNKKQQNCLIYALGINYVIYLLMRLFFYPIYESQLDEMVQAAVCGVSGIRTAYILYSNVLLGWILKGLTFVMPFVNWYFAGLCAGAFGALSVISYVLLKRTYNKMGLTACVVLVSFAGYECYALPGSIKTASILGTAMLIVLADYMETAKAGSRKREFFIGFLAVLSSLVNFSVCLATVLIGLSGIGVYFGVCHRDLIRSWLKKRGPAGGRKAVRHFVSAAGCILVAAVSFYIVDDFSCRYSGQEDAADYRLAVMRMYGFGMGDYEESYEEDYGIDAAEYAAVKSGSFAVPGESVWKVLKELSEDWAGISGASVNAYFKTVPIGLFKYGIFYLFIIMLFFLFFSPVREKKALIWAEVGLLLFSFLGAYLFHAWQSNRMVFMVLFPVSIPLFLALRGAKDAEYPYVWVYLAILSVILYSKFSSGMVSSVSEEDMAEKFAAVNTGQMNLVDMNAYFKSFSAQQAYTVNMSGTQSVRISNGAYALLEGFDAYVLTEVPAEGTYGWVYNPAGVSVGNLVLED